MANLFSSLVIFLMLLGMAVSVAPQDLWRVRHERSLVARAVLSVLVLVPLFALGLTFIGAIPQQTQVALALLAAAPGAPLASHRAAALGSNLATAMALQLTVANLGVLTAPLMLMLMAWTHGLSVHLPVAPLAWQLFTVQVIPLALGALLRYSRPEFTQRLSKPLSRTANLAMLILCVMVVVKMGPLMLTFDAATWLALLAFSAFALTVGHALGGPEGRTRRAVAVCSANRNLGMAVLIGSMLGEGSVAIQGKHAPPYIMTFALVNFLVSTAYVTIASRLQDTREEAAS